MTRKINFTNKFLYIVILFTIFIVSHVFYLFSGPKTRYTVEFPEIGTEDTVTEIRFLPRNPVQGKINAYVEEILLGPSVPRSRPLFSRGTKADFCFLREKTLYVGLNVQAVYQDAESEKFGRGKALFEKNIKKNFPSVKKIEFFVDGHEVKSSEKSDEKN